MTDSGSEEIRPRQASSPRGAGAGQRRKGLRPCCLSAGMGPATFLCSSWTELPLKPVVRKLGVTAHLRVSIRMLSKLEAFSIPQNNLSFVLELLTSSIYAHVTGPFRKGEIERLSDQVYSRYGRRILKRIARPYVESAWPALKAITPGDGGGG